MRAKQNVLTEHRSRPSGEALHRAYLPETPPVSTPDWEPAAFSRGGGG